MMIQIYECRIFRDVMRFLSSFGDNAAIVLVKPIESIEFLCRTKTTMGKPLTMANTKGLESLALDAITL
jgi:hypothetical protein